MKLLILVTTLAMSCAAIAQPTDEETKTCVSQELTNQIRSSIDKFVVTGMYAKDEHNIDMVIAIHSDNFIGQGFVEIKNGDYANAKFLVQGLKPQSLDLTSCF